jgi:hypothetical protein
MKTNLLCLAALLFICCSCHRDKGTDECVWTKETTAMTSSTCKMSSSTSYDNCSTITSTDSVPYALLQVVVVLQTQYLPYEVCSSPRDSIVGNIAKITVISLNDYNSAYISGDTINAICNTRYLTNLGSFSVINSLGNYLLAQPVCTPELRLYLTQGPTISSVQNFRIIYTETGGRSFTVETGNVLIKS